MKSYEKYIIVPELSIDPSVNVETTTFSTFSEQINNKTCYTEIFVSGNTTLLSSLNVADSTYLNTVNVQGNLNVYGTTTTVIDTVINNTTFNSFSVSGPSIHYSNVTLLSSLNVSGNTSLSNGLSVTGTITSSAGINSNFGISNFKGVYIMNPNGTQTHFPYIRNNQNYIRGKLNIDQEDLFVGGSITSSGYIQAQH